MVHKGAGVVSHDPEDEVTVISADGVGKGVLRGNAIEMVAVSCPGCGDKGYVDRSYGQRCPTCKPRASTEKEQS